MASTGAQRKLDPTIRSKETKLLVQQFTNKVVGQEKATKILVDIFESFKAGFVLPDKPAGNALFLGPTGTGKTHVVETFAESLFGTKRACIRIDCAEFQHSHEIAKLIGSPPGYLGHRETHPALEQEVLDKYHTDSLKLSILLFDEIEKASDALWSLLLGVLDKASVTLGDNRKVNFCNTIIVMTSNLGAREMANRGIGFAEMDNEEKDQVRLEQIAVSAAKSKFTPEFMNRIQNIVTFTSLNQIQMEKILEFELRDFAYQLYVMSNPLIVQADLISGDPTKQNRVPIPRFEFFVSPAAKRALLKEGFSREYGARPIKRVIEKYVQNPITKLILSEQIVKDDHIIIDYHEEVGYEYISQGAPITNERS
jgi:ATP-dependent Clp protease ATP-binding subunit ClpA